MGFGHYGRVFNHRQYPGDTQYIGGCFPGDRLNAGQLAKLTRLAFDGVVNIDPGSASAGCQFQPVRVK